MGRFLVIGEALVDVITTLSPQGSGVPLRLPGGSPTNVAVGLGRLGHDVTEITSIGNDADGDLIRTHLETNGVRIHDGSVPASATSIAFASLGASGDARYTFSISWDAPTSTEWGAIDIVHAGSIALALQPGARRVLELLDSRPDGVRISIDPNVRSNFFSQEAASRLQLFLARADVAKLSEEDASFLYPHHRDADETIDHLLSLGASIVAVTLGAAGSIVATKSERVRLPSMATHVLDTVGAGDSFTVGLLDAIATLGKRGWRLDGDLLRAVAISASRAAAFAVGRRGADFPTRQDLAGVVSPVEPSTY